MTSNNGVTQPANDLAVSLRILDHLPTLMWRANLEGLHDYFNRAWLAFTGLSLEAALGRGWVESVHPGDVERVLSEFQRAVQARQPFEITYRLRRSSDEYRWIQDSGQPYTHLPGEISGYIGTCSDISDRLEMEQGLREREALFKGLFEAVPDGVVVVDGEGRIRLVNHQGLAMFGYSNGELIGQMVEKLLPPVYRDRHSQHTGGFMAHPRLRPMGAGLDLFGQRKNGEVFPADIMLGPVQVSGHTWVLATVRDISDRKRTEAELDQYRLSLETLVQQRTQELERSNRDLQDFAFIASHDLQEPLRKVITFGERLEGRTQDGIDETSQDYLRRMIDAAQRMQHMLNALLTYSRIATTAQAMETVSLDSVLADVVSDLEVRLEETGGQVEVGPLPEIRAEPAQMRQLFQNLVGNALKFHRPGVPPQVKVYACRPETRSRAGTPMIEIRVEDNGVGFDESYLDRIFQPFTRLHGRGEFEGSGIGLAVCRKIVERHHGELTAESQEDAGSTFKIRLPV